MEFKFDANQEFQTAAVEAVTDLFEGQPRNEVDITFALTAGFAAVANRLDLTEGALLDNLQGVQAQASLQADSKLACIEEGIETAAGTKQARFPNFSVEMETGTGKTYVYVRTALELFRRHAFRKFIIVVPSVAVREGVLKTFQVTDDHFHLLYDNLPYRYYVYDSEDLSQVRQFALSGSLEFMVMTIDSFTRESTVIRQTTDRLQGEVPIHLVQAARPILILDEPQNMESELRVKALSALDPLFALRYSATHRNPHNLIYRLTPFDAYRQGLVKRIEVASVVKEGQDTRPFLRLDGVRTKKKTLTARVALHKRMKSGAVKEKMVTVRPGDSLEKKAGRSEYAGFQVDAISAASQYVRFTNDIELTVGQSQGADKEALFEAQIGYTIEEHFRKQARLKDQGIKVLSLFFIDRVDNYARADGLIRRQFEQAFNRLKAAHEDWAGVDPARVQAAYFAQKRRRGGAVDTLDSVSGKTKEDEAAYELIMKDKERLLSFDEPVAFIFSHSALREGWDNPNIFQICTLNQTASEVKKRQEVGRGVRLAVDQTGERIRDERINVLTVVANESYQRYVERLQSEIEEEYGKEGVPPKPADARKRGVAKLRKEFTLKPEFKELWERIKHRTRYAVKIDKDKLVNEVVAELDAAEIRPLRITVQKAEVQAALTDSFETSAMSAPKIAIDLTGRFPLPDLVELMSGLMEQTTPPVRITRGTLLEVFKRLQKNKNAVMGNPQEFATLAVRTIKEKLADQLVDGIRYEKIDQWYEMTQFEAEIESWMEYLVPAENSVYDHVIFDSELEKSFVEGLEARKDVKLYLKLPNWFKVATPVGEYNPDWAIVMEERDEHGEPTGKPLLYLVRETKAENWKTSLRPNELRKIRCGERHFKDALDVDYKVVARASDLP
ncbi:MAG TPA: DEAD/DEAH box helicase family protein [Terriglobia bacterium]|nr:DEAD/DEAH box helicase family protein [Terriglobia bacterium]